MVDEHKKFNIRVYGIYIENEKILISIEQIGNYTITKFIGGGLEYGEGIKDCLIREFKEELNLDVEIISHFYTTDFFVESFVNKNHQVISVYYLIRPTNGLFSIEKLELSSNQKLAWLDLKEARVEDLSLTIDKKVLSMLIDQKNNQDLLVMM